MDRSTRTITTTVAISKIHPVDVTPLPTLKTLLVEDPIFGLKEEISMFREKAAWRFHWTDRNTAFVNLPHALESAGIAEILERHVNPGSQPHTVYVMRLRAI